MVSLAYPPYKIGNTDTFQHPSNLTLTSGGHLEAFFNLKRICLEEMCNTREKLGKIIILEIGNGSSGVTRTIIEPKLIAGDEMAIYDPFRKKDVKPIHSDRRVQYIDINAAIMQSNERFTNVNLTYFLSLLEPDVAKKLLRNLAIAHPRAQFLVTDYILGGREECSGLLTSTTEEGVKNIFGKRKLQEICGRFDAKSLKETLVECGLKDPSKNSWYLDSNLFRATMVTEPE